MSNAAAGEGAPGAEQAPDENSSAPLAQRLECSDIVFLEKITLQGCRWEWHGI